MSGTTQGPPTAAMTIAAGQASIFPVAYGYYPSEGSRCVTTQYDWTNQLAYAEDLSQLVARGVETTIQSAFIDNSANNSVVSLLINGTGQLIVVPAGNQGVFPLFFSGNPGFQISVPTLTGVTRLFLLNVPVSGGAIWSPSGSALASVAQGSTTLGQAGALVQGAVTTNAPAYTAGTTDPLSLTANGALRVAPITPNGSSAVLTFTQGGGGTPVGGIYHAAPLVLVDGNTSWLALDSASGLLVNHEQLASVYSATLVTTVAAAATDIVTLTGSATKTVRIHEIKLSFAATAAIGQLPVSVQRRSAANTGGASTVGPTQSHDTNNSVATAVPTVYTANATGLGASNGPIDQFFLSTGAGTAMATPFVLTYGSTDQSVVLRGVGQSFCVNLEGATVPAGLVARIKIKWSEV